MDLKIDEKELYQKKVSMFQEEIKTACDKFGLDLVPTISYTDTGIIPTISLIPRKVDLPVEGEVVPVK